MRKFTFNRKTICITEKEWEALLARWDASKAKKNIWDQVKIEMSCVFCEIHYRGKCRDCPFDTFRLTGLSHGCCDLVRGLIRKYGNFNDCKHLYYNRDSIYWYPEEAKQALRAINAIRKGILSAVRVKKRGGCRP